MINLAHLKKSGFVFHELMTTDVEGARKFYQEVTRLKATRETYSMLMDGDRPVAGLVGPRAEAIGWPSGGPEPHWIAYVAVDDVEAAAKKAQELGGRILLQPIDIPGFGRAAVLKDPQGAAFGIFETVP